MKRKLKWVTFETLGNPPVRAFVCFCGKQWFGDQLRSRACPVCKYEPPWIEVRQLQHYNVRMAVQNRREQ